MHVPLFATIFFMVVACGISPDECQLDLGDQCPVILGIVCLRFYKLFHVAAIKKSRKAEENCVSKYYIANYGSTDALGSIWKCIVFASVMVSIYNLL
jgi:hypothetical protein